MTDMRKNGIREAASYSPLAGWAKLPEGVALGYTHGLAEDTAGRIYVFNMSRHAVAIFEPDGEYVGSWGEEYAAGAHGLCLDREADGTEYLYVTDIRRHRVAKHTLDGREVLVLDVPPLSDIYEKPDKYRPTDVGVAPNGDIYVADGYGEYLIHRYDKDGRWLQSWGGRGDAEDGKLYEPHGLWVDGSESGATTVYVADRRHRRFVQYAADGELLGTFGGDYMLPCDLVGAGDYYCIPDLNSRVVVADREFNVIARLGESSSLWQDARWPAIPPAEWPARGFVSPHAVHVDGEGAIYVVEWVPEGRITKWVPQA
ncbi:hypothetical protein [Cohnella hashimotonis]|uniref:NHL repeat containing protein n=1 Tax=Cohnella hashimotonis TaxID=2826895 RepID=A0ABT6TTA0_9BACL|nr:hypothetical protein [Cohnella hashimotonis]MDI4650089.1 hypothetical protein [Cohnella hashimotonis]